MAEKSGKINLGQKVGPLPIWGWGLIGLGGVYCYRKETAAAAASVTSGSPTTPDQSTVDTSSYDAGYMAGTASSYQPGQPTPAPAPPGGTTTPPPGGTGNPVTGAATHQLLGMFGGVNERRYVAAGKPVYVNVAGAKGGKPVWVQIPTGTPGLASGPVPANSPYKSDPVYD